MSTRDKQAAAPAEAPRRMTLSQVVEALLNRGSSEHSSVTISRNAKGETQLEVVVRTGDAGEVATIEEAETAAQAVYDRLRTAYPFGETTGSGSAGSRE
jgi:hypothetical protein